MVPSSRWTQTVQNGYSTAIQFRKFREHPDAFHKICQVGAAIIGLCVGRDPQHTEKFARLFILLKSADLHYFLNFIKMPFHYFFPVRVDTVDHARVEREILDRYFSNLGLITGLDDITAVCNAVKAELKAMEGGTDPKTGAYTTSYGYRSVEEFENALVERVRTLNGFAEPNGGRGDPIDVLKKSSWLERINTILWGVADIGVVFLYLNEWKMLDTARIGQSLGNIPGLSWLKNQTLDNWVWGICVVAHSINFNLSISRYLGIKGDSKSTTHPHNLQGLSNARFDAIVSLAEIAFNGASFLDSARICTIDKRILFALAILAKGSGLYNIYRKMSQENA